MTESISHFSKKQRKAFTLIELLLVMIVAGILASLAIPRLERDRSQEASDNVLSAIRYTRLKAVTDDKTDPRYGNWQRSFWMIRFTVSNDPEGIYYIIASDANRSGSITKNEAAVDPGNGKYFFNSSGSFTARAADESPNAFIGHKYGITNIGFSGGCNGNYHHIAFDRLGRPYVGITSASNKYSKYMKQDCNITFSLDNGKSFSIIVEKQTGHSYIDGQPDS